MARNRREHEDHLEANEPLPVVLLNDLAYLLEDLSEVILDLAKLHQSRRDEVVELIKTAKNGPGKLMPMIPPAILGTLIASGQQLAGEGAKLKAQLTTPGEDGKKGKVNIWAALDPDKIDPEALASFGNLLQEKVGGLQASIAEFEKGFLEQNPPPGA